MELWRLVVGVATWRYGVTEARCRRVDVEAWSYEAPELWRSVAGVETWRYAALDV